MENVAIDPLAGLSNDLPENTAREHAAALVLGNGTSLEAANAALAARGMPGLTANSREAAEAARAGLLADSVFVTRYGAGDPEAIAKLFQADLRVQQSSGALMDRPAAAADYSLSVAPHMPDAPVEGVQSYSRELASLAAAVQLPKENAQALVDDHFAAVAATAGMSAEEKGQYAQRETAVLHNLLGADAGAQIKAASDTLSRASDRKLDLAAIVQSNGASVALTLFHQAQVLARRK